jgi:hypothetical protein
MIREGKGSESSYVSVNTPYPMLLILTRYKLFSVKFILSRLLIIGSQALVFNIHVAHMYILAK